MLSIASENPLCSWRKNENLLIFPSFFVRFFICFVVVVVVFVYFYFLEGGRSGEILVCFASFCSCLFVVEKVRLSVLFSSCLDMFCFICVQGLACEFD